MKISKVKLNIVRKNLSGIIVTEASEILSGSGVDMELKDNHIAIKTDGRTVCIPLSVVLWFEAEESSAKEGDVIEFGSGTKTKRKRRK